MDTQKLLNTMLWNLRAVAWHGCADFITCRNIKARVKR